MEIKVAKESGFCFGVKLAVDSANQALESCEPIYCLGQLIHNNSVTDDLENRGLIVVDDIHLVPDGSKIIFRSHGVSKSIYEIAKSKKLSIIDSTCPFVTKIHRIVEEHYKKGYGIIIVGKANHPEVIGINGWCDNSAIIIETEQDVDKIADLSIQMHVDNSLDLSINEGESLKSKYCVVTQTTNNQQLWQNIIKKIGKNNAIIVDFFDTICYTTNIRQVEAKEVSSNSEIMLVLGNKQSANTNKLLTVCKSNCDASFLIGDMDDLIGLDDSIFGQDKVVGITAGASTPFEFIQQVVDYLNQHYNIQSKAEIVDSHTFV
ncbi:MAG: 4-hydroxy-3-methylbut-2-enyl diphosphate reductase [Firmicutes bacterium]|nr:4-hydroxy-3-methylbut-2-enyl diphosphate reductase [Bacillota bacterium]